MLAVAPPSSITTCIHPLDYDPWMKARGSGLYDFTVYTDGSCYPNPGPGGWAYVIVDLNSGQRVAPNHFSIMSGMGTEQPSTNVRMEIMAALKAVAALPEGARAAIHVDCMLVVQAMNGWVRQWKKVGWLTAERKPVTNRELWEELDALRSRRFLRWIHIRGHRGNFFNEVCDVLAGRAARTLL